MRHKTNDKHIKNITKIIVNVYARIPDLLVTIITLSFPLINFFFKKNIIILRPDKNY